MYAILWFALLGSLLFSANSQFAELVRAQNPCVSKSTCQECLQTPTCAWCLKPDYGDRSKCFQPSSSGLNNCPEEYTFNPDNMLQTLIARQLTKAHEASGSAGGMESSGSSSRDSSGGSSSTGDFGESNIVQISPQRVKLQLRAREPYNLRMHYTQAEDYPVDLYYLMDLSNSMEDDKDKLSRLGDLLAESMRKITSNFRLGVGSFVGRIPKKLNTTCLNCQPSYGFRNHMSLSSDSSRFSTMVKEAVVSGILDTSDGGFDAIMQAVVCRDQIGWRKNARRLLVFSTNAGFHYARDAKLGRIVEPNDGMCHLQDGLYTHSSLQDYPSISQINLKVKQNGVNMIFAVTEEQIEVYRKLQANIEGASSGQLSNDSSNIVDLVKEQYQQISSTVEMRDNSTSSIKISYYSRCLNSTGNDRKTNKCEGIKVGDVVTFRIEIEVTSCPRDPKEWRQTLQLYPVGINESLIVDLEMLCSCPCEHPGNAGYKELAEECSGFGTYKCGICECDNIHFGRFCECSATVSYDIDPTLNCRPDNNSTINCSGRGSCICGQCDCYIPSKKDEKIYGKFCECDDFSCDRHEGKICSGPTHGTCQCGVCHCIDPWGGAACECQMSNKTCYAPDAPNGKTENKNFKVSPIK